jgi:hypothetical protein
VSARHQDLFVVGGLTVAIAAYGSRIILNAFETHRLEKQKWEKDNPAPASEQVKGFGRNFQFRYGH